MSSCFFNQNLNAENMSRFQILSLIGGGIRGAFVTSFLKELEDQLGRPIADCFDLIAGTSTGGIIATGLAAGMSADQMQDFYVRYGAKIFSPRPRYSPKGVSTFLYPVVNKLLKKKMGSELSDFFRSRYCPHALYESFGEGFGDRTIDSIRHTRLIVPAVNLTRGTPHVFRTAHLPESVTDQDVKICDLLVAATAAPTYFPHKEINGQAFADGGLWAADPSMLAYAEAMRIRNECRQGNCEPAFEPDEIHVLSIGTGISQYSLAPPGGDAGVAYWVRHVADVMGSAQTQGIHQPLKFILGNNYTHLNFKMEAHWPLDGVENIPELFALGKKRAAEEFPMIEGCFFGHQRTQFEHYDFANGAPTEIRTEFNSGNT
jgi:hypothetical protein